jgi:quinol monooxygenase YgiN
MVGLIAKLKIKEGKMEEAVQLFQDLIPHIRKEEGTLFYTLNRDSSNPNLLVVMERYRDMAALQVHSTTPQFADFVVKSGPLMDGSLEMTILEEIASI